MLLNCFFYTYITSNSYGIIFFGWKWYAVKHSVKISQGQISLSEIFMGPNFTLPGYSTAILTLPPHRPSPLLKLGPPPEIDFFDVSDDLEHKFFFCYKKNFGLRKFFKTIFFLPFFFGSIMNANLTLNLLQVLLTWRPNPAGQFFDDSILAGQFLDVL